ncbi:MAG: hypothetical protein JW852_02035 [Spirochaetales bacterium]|nr:hypothetical protein [Spirochaetales bacterium]
MKIPPVTIFLLMIMTPGLLAQEERGVSFGIHLLGGGRYDNVRMCVGSPPGVPGGPIGEFYFDVKVPVSEKGTVVFNIPLFRPVMFGVAFKMLQLEPLVTYEHLLGGDTGARPVIGGGAGIIFHYGPDYNSSPDDRGESFFSIGPIVHGFAGFAIGESNFTSGIRGFFSPLFTPDRPRGVVAGGGVEVHYDF